MLTEPQAQIHVFPPFLGSSPWVLYGSPIWPVPQARLTSCMTAQFSCSHPPQTAHISLPDTSPEFSSLFKPDHRKQNLKT